MQKKHGVSLIVLSITILVMAILAATAIIALEDSGIIGRSKNTVSTQNRNEEYTRLQVIKNGILTDNLGEIAVEEYISELQSKGIIQGTVTTDEYGNKKVQTQSGLDVYIAQDGQSNLKISFEQIVTTLGSLVTAADYGKTINYSVTIEEGTLAGTYSNWKVYYEDETNGYVYIISDSIGNKALGTYENSTYTGYGDASALTTEQLALYKKFKLGQDGYTLNSANANSNAVAYLITDFGDFANKTASYGSYVEGAIGGPTLELMCAGWNAWNEAKKAEDATHTYTALTPSSDASWSGYKINDATYISGLTNDGFYINSSYYYWMASPSASYAYTVMGAGNGRVNVIPLRGTSAVRPVVCLKSNIPAVANAAGTGFEI